MAFRWVMLKDSAPEPGIFVCIFEVTVGQIRQASDWTGAKIDLLAQVMQLIQRFGIHLFDEVVDAFENLVERADRIANRLGDLASRQRRQTLLSDDFARGIERHPAQFISRVIRSSSHFSAPYEK
jgi:tRNA A-37 threonylcarbamoyl transferase component Bud32